MGNRVLEIVVFLMSQLKDHQGQFENMDDVSSYLKSHGFTENEISSAYSWVMDQLQTDSSLLLDDAQSAHSTRVITEQDRRHFTIEAIGYLMQLRYLGLLNDSQIELILERGSYLGSATIDLEQVKMIVSSLLFREPDVMESGRHQIFLMPEDEGRIN